VEYHTGHSFRPSYLPVNVLSPSFWHMKEQNGESARKIKVSSSTNPPLMWITIRIWT
jgi:hypothetical protein